MGKSILTMIISAGVFLLLLCGCSVIPEREDPAVETGEEGYVMTFTAGSSAAQEEDDITRAIYTHDTPKGSYKWVGNEELSVFILDPDGNILEKNLKFTTVSGSLAADGSTVSFEGTIPGGRPVTGSTYYMVHPYSESCLFRIVGEGETAEHLIDVNIPTEQEYSATGAVDVPLLARATESGGDLTATFTSMCAKIVIPIKITSSNPNWSSPLRSVRIRNNHFNPGDISMTHITGLGRVNMKNFKAGDVFMTSNNGNRTASVVFPDAGYTIRNGTELEVVIMTRTFQVVLQGGLVIDLITDDGYMASKTYKTNKLITSLNNNRANILPEVTIDLSDFRTGYRFDNSTLENPQSPTSGDGSPEDPWRITNANQLAGLDAFIGKRENQHVRLETDIEITAESWIPLECLNIFSFGTIFDGNGHIISGKMVNNTNMSLFGLWKNAGNYGTVKNLHISADIVDNVAHIIAPFIVTIKFEIPDRSLLLENCTYSGTIHQSTSLEEYLQGTDIGGIIGRIFEDTSADDNTSDISIIISKCAMTGSVRTHVNVPYISGIIGSVALGSDDEQNRSITIENCIVAGTFDNAASLTELYGLVRRVYLNGIDTFIILKDNTVSSNVIRYESPFLLWPLTNTINFIGENNNTSGITVLER